MKANRMTRDNCVVFLVVLTLLWTPSTGDVHCIFMESCILPCSFNPGPDIVIHWKQGDKVVHSYFRQANYLSHQDKSFRGRTSLFESEIGHGNVSLQLKKVEIQDRGQYKCYTSTINGNKEQFVSVKVEAPVRTVNIEQTEDSITCRSNDIYPKPELTWSTTPPSNLTWNETVHQTEQQVYTIRSSLHLFNDSKDLEYICTVTCGKSFWKATVMQKAPVTSIDSEATIPCIVSQTVRSQVWIFNYTEVILNKTGANINSSSKWEQKLKEVSQSDNLTLKDLSSDQQGTYTCEVTTADGTYITNTFLNVQQSSQAEKKGVTVAVAVAIAVPVAVFCVILLGAGIIVYCKCKKKSPPGSLPEHPNRTPPDNPREMIPLNPPEGTETTSKIPSPQDNGELD